MGESLDGMGQLVSQARAYRLHIALMGAIAPITCKERTFRSGPRKMPFTSLRNKVCSFLIDCGNWLTLLGWDYYV